jgi:GMP synthase (glutamine-hydrolysing)
MEFTREVVELLIKASADDLLKLADRRFVQQAEALRANDYREMNEKLFGFLDALALEYKG